MERPILYSFRRCPYCIRARIAIAKAHIHCDMREIDLKDKPQDMLDISPKGTVPVLQLTDGTVIDESINIMYWAMQQSDPDGWLDHPKSDVDAIIKECDTSFATAVTRYKYPNRYNDLAAETGREEAMAFLSKLEDRISQTGFIVGKSTSLADIAVVSLVRQFAKVDSDWFHSQNSLKSTCIWLNYFQDSELFDAAMEKYAIWQPGDPTDIFPIYKAA